jgi:hypothetical protein
VGLTARSYLFELKTPKNETVPSQPPIPKTSLLVGGYSADSDVDVERPATYFPLVMGRLS